VDSVNEVVLTQGPLIHKNLFPHDFPQLEGLQASNDWVQTEGT
jgi:hypothetical protein